MHPVEDLQKYWGEGSLRSDPARVSQGGLFHLRAQLIMQYRRESPGQKMKEIGKLPKGCRGLPEN